ncbi:MAG: Spx/MgsR family RNA polymerase-binding regulatory protein [Ruoffia tabacinasalis]|uniref:Spx/MgsR family RNA polymerase-binding regulatory protein n=1 Tax=unclassified Ruoffia TaxID=2862149 RepID=UPI000EBF74D2|nr:arsenate reductase [Aerococcaceae bacterium]
MLTIYGLGHCTTTKKAKKYLEDEGVSVDDIIDIRDNPPSEEVIQQAIASKNGQVRKIMNTSGNLYREMDLKDKLDTMNESEIIDLLSKNGMLIKRPLITDGKTMTNGAKESVLKAAWLNN